MKRILLTLIAGMALVLAMDTVSYKDSFENYALSSGAPNWVIHSVKWEYKNGAVRHHDQLFSGGLVFMSG